MTWLVAFATRSMIFTRVDLTVKLPALTKFFLVKHEKQQGGFMEPIQFYFLETKKKSMGFGADFILSIPEGIHPLSYAFFLPIVNRES